MSLELDGVPVTEIQVLRLQPGDVLVLKVPTHMTTQEHVRLEVSLRGFLNSVGLSATKSMVLPDDLSLEVVRPAAEGEETA